MSALRIGHDPRELALVRGWLLAQLAQQDWSLPAVERGLLEVAVTEAAANIQQHGMVDPPLAVQCFWWPGRLELELRYRGRAFVGAPTPRPGPLEERGRGLLLIDAGVDAVSYAQEGRDAVVRLVKRRGAR